MRRLTALLLGGLCAAVLLELGLRAGGLAFQFRQERRNREALGRRDAYRVLCLGDSMTAGTYPRFLEEALNERAAGPRFSVFDEGKVNADSGRILQGLPAQLSRYRPDIVVVMMGANDRDAVLPYGRVPPGGRAPLRSLRWLRLLRYLLREAPPPPPEAAPRGSDVAEADGAWREGNRRKDRGDLDRARALLEKAVRLDPGFGPAYGDLADTEMLRRRPAAATPLLEKAAALRPDDIAARTRLGEQYLRVGDYARAERALREAAKLAPDNARIQGALASCYLLLGRPGPARRHLAESNALHLAHAAAATRENYRALRLAVLHSGARLVCVQYPRRSVAALKALFDDDQGILFVDNEKSFARALRGADPADYFVDWYAGDFGHCTQKGYRLLARSVADAILGGLFGL